MLQCEKAALKSISARVLGSFTASLAVGTVGRGHLSFWPSAAPAEMAERRVDAVKQDSKVVGVKEEAVEDMWRLDGNGRFSDPEVGEEERSNRRAQSAISLDGSDPLRFLDPQRICRPTERGQDIGAVEGHKHFLRDITPLSIIRKRSF